MRFIFILWVTASVVLTGCQDKSVSPPVTDAKPSQTPAPQTQNASLAVWRQGDVVLQNTHQALLALRVSVQSLLAQPDQAQLESARTQWHVAHNAFQQFALFFALAQAHPGLYAQLGELHDRIDGWPIQPGFLDYFDVYIHSGLVNDIAVPVTAKTLREAHQQFDVEDRALGLHPIAYLLWGDKGQRPVSDFQPQTTQVKGEDERRQEDLPNNRRRALLGLMLELTLDDLQTLQQHWQAKSPFSNAFEQLDPDQRSEMLRISTIYLIEQQLISKQLQPQLDRYKHPDDEPVSHNAYSGRSRSSLAAQLASLNLLLEVDPSNGLIDQWSHGASQSWRAQLQVVTQALEKIPNEGQATETNWVAAIAALQQLAQPLKPHTEAIQN